MKKFSLKGIYISNLYFVIRIEYFLIFLNFLYVKVGMFVDLWMYFNVNFWY